MKHNINMLDLLVVFLSLDRPELFTSDGKLSSSSSYNANTKLAYDSYMNSESEQSRYDSIINEFYTKLGVNKDEFITTEEYRLEVEEGFMERGSYLLDADLGFGDDAKFINVANIGTLIYLKFNPKNLASKFYESQDSNEHSESPTHSDSSEHDNSSKHDPNVNSETKAASEKTRDKDVDFKLSMKFNSKEILGSIAIFLLIKTISKH